MVRFPLIHLKNLCKASHNVFKWIKQHLKVKSFWGENENAVRIQIHVAIITYCLIGIIEHDHQVGRPIVEVMRILGHSLLTTDEIDDLLKPIRREAEKVDDGHLYFRDCLEMLRIP